MILRQEINLYQNVAVPTRMLLAGSDVFIAMMCIVAALLAFWCYGYMQVSKLSRELASVHEQQVQQQQQLQSALQASAAPEEVAIVEARVASLKTQVAARSAALQLLAGEEHNSTTGFASRLEALARRHVEGLWLDSMSLTSTREEMSLSGATQEPQLISQYLHSLSQDPALTGVRFNEFAVERTHGDDAHTTHAVVRFHASSPGLAPATEDKS